MMELRKAEEMTNKKMMHEARVMHARQEADSRLRRALEKKVREHKMEKAIQENKGNYRNCWEDSSSETWWNTKGGIK